MYIQFYSFWLFDDYCLHTDVSNKRHHRKEPNSRSYYPHWVSPFVSSSFDTSYAQFTLLLQAFTLTLTLVVIFITLSFFRKFLSSSMSKVNRSSRPSNRQNFSPEFTASVSQFMAVTNLPIKDATKYIQKYGKAELAIDAYYNDPDAMLSASPTQTRREPTTQSQVQKLNALFEKYKGIGSVEQGDIISIDGTIKLCADLEVDPEDVVLLAVAYELKAPGVGEFTRAGWRDGWRNLGIDSLAGMKNVLPRLRRNLGSDFKYFKKVYQFTFDFARSEGQRSLATDTAQAFWGLLLPHGVHGGALAHVEEDEDNDDDDDESMADDDVGLTQGWSDKHTEWWFDFLSEKGGKGISRDTWTMFISFARTIDPKFRDHNLEAAWPSTIDDFVEWAREHRLND